MKERLDVGGVERSGEEEALSAVAVLALEVVELGLLFFDPLGDGLETRVLPNWTRVWISIDESRVVASELMNERSILRKSTGNWRR